MKAKTGEVPSDGPQTPKHAFTNKDTHPLVLDLLLIKEFGPDYLGWEPETLWLEIGRNWGVATAESSRNKIQAMRTCHVSDQPYTSWGVFEKVAGGLMGLSPKFDLIQRATPHRAAAALEIMSQARDNRPVSDQVYKYIAACLLDAGMVYGPGPLEPCNKHMTKFVGADLQKSVKSAISAGRTPTFDGANSSDVQVMKSLSVKDFIEYVSRLLLMQLKRLIN
jgi:hypothetical protein